MKLLALSFFSLRPDKSELTGWVDNGALFRGGYRSFATVVKRSGSTRLLDPDSPQHPQRLVGNASQLVGSGLIEGVLEVYRRSPINGHVYAEVINGKGVELRFRNESKVHRVAEAEAEISGLKGKRTWAAAIFQINRDTTSWRRWRWRRLR